MNVVIFFKYPIHLGKWGLLIWSWYNMWVAQPLHYSNWMWGIFCRILSISQNIVMNLNNVRGSNPPINVLPPTSSQYHQSTDKYNYTLRKIHTIVWKIRCHTSVHLLCQDHQQSHSHSSLATLMAPVHTSQMHNQSHHQVPKPKNGIHQDLLSSKYNTLHT